MGSGSDAVASVTDSEKRLADDIEVALQALPNKVVTNVNANVTLGYEFRSADDSNGLLTWEGHDIAFLHVDVEFVGASTMGPQTLLTVEANECGVGCTPRLTGLNLVSVSEDLSRLISFVT